MKRKKFLVPLSQDHHQGLQAAAYLRRELAKDGPREKLASFVSDLWNEELQPHFRVEEELLVPLAKTTETSELAGRMMDDHTAIRALIQRIVTREAGGEDDLKRLPDVLVAHIRFEERELFPALEAEVPETALREAGARLHARRSDK